MGHTEDFIHARGDGVNGGSAADFVVKFGTVFFAEGDDLFAFFAVGIPGVFSFGAGFLAEGGEGDLGEAVFDDFVAFGELIFFPEPKFTSSALDGFGDFFNLLVGQREVVNLFPLAVFEAIVLGALSNK